MYYWNRNNFTGLKRISETYSSREGYAGFADYCALREQGLKKQALGALAAFIAQLRQSPRAHQREVAEELASLAFFNPEVHQLLPHPLQSCLVEILEHWSREQPSLPGPLRWLGFVKSDRNYFIAALRVDPDDEISLARLAQAHLRDVDYQTHHLSESRFIGSEEEAARSLKEAAAHVMRLPVGDGKRKLLDEVAYYRALLEAWEGYRSSGKSNDFPDWCHQKGLGFHFWSVVYYEN